ncbi:MAG: hypothetical protein GVY13_07855 [Alphaproteobacteria bacterium]|jgi:uncharacterized protein (DUF4415 family)|nr:hypothetical protein [Alphaproteobacteria bacterium]
MQDRTSYARTDSEDEIARQETTDPDLAAIPEDWIKHARLETGIPEPPSSRRKRSVNIRLDPEIVEFFEAQGRGWQTRINAVLKAYVDTRQSSNR